MQTKYAIRTIGFSQMPCYLRQGQYGLTFAYVTDPREIYCFDSREDAIHWIEDNQDGPYRYMEIVEVHIS